MADEKDKEKQKKGAEDGPPDPADMSDTEKNKLIKKQQAEIDKLTAQVEDLQKQLDDANAAKKAVVRRAKAEKLLAAWEEAGREFESDDSRTAELDRLMKLTDEAFDATEETVRAFAAGKKKPKDENVDPEADPNADENDNPFPPKKKKPKGQEKKASLKADAGQVPYDSADGPCDLQSQLTTGFMAAYKDRARLDS